MKFGTRPNSKADVYFQIPNMILRVAVVLIFSLNCSFLYFYEIH